MTTNDKPGPREPDSALVRGARARTALRWLREYLQGLAGADTWAATALEQLAHIDPALDPAPAELHSPLAEQLGPQVSKSAAEEALDRIAEIGGCPSWDYPGQVVRDVQALRDQLGTLRAVLGSYRRACDRRLSTILELRARLDKPRPPEPGTMASILDTLDHEDRMRAAGRLPPLGGSRS